MDFDTTRKKDAHQQIYHAFKNHEADILIGTQMIARGLDFDDVTLAAVIAADGLLTSGDYRAEERTFSMIEQVGGRAGRKKPGRVIVQTYNPEHYAIQFAARHDYEGFYNQEIVFRKAAMKPPFSRVFRLVFTLSLIHILAARDCWPAAMSGTGAWRSPRRSLRPWRHIFQKSGISPAKRCW